MDALEYRGVKFDDYTINEDKTVWSQICNECCVKESHNIRYVDLDFHSGHGICGVKGCSNESDHYIDFQMFDCKND